MPTYVEQYWIEHNVHDEKAGGRLWGVKQWVLDRIGDGLVWLGGEERSFVKPVGRMTPQEKLRLAREFYNSCSDEVKEILSDQARAQRLRERYGMGDLQQCVHSDGSVTWEDLPPQSKFGAFGVEEDSEGHKVIEFW